MITTEAQPFNALRFVHTDKDTNRERIHGRTQDLHPDIQDPGDELI